MWIVDTKAKLTEHIGNCRVVDSKSHEIKKKHGKQGILKVANYRKANIEVT